jgi:hypothetical protein
VTLVHLGHPVIAMRCLSSAWNDNAVDADTGVWLISEVLKSGSDESKVDASGLLANMADKLPDEHQSGNISWPDALWDQWQTKIPEDGRFYILEAIVRTLLSRDRGWWGSSHGWAVIALDEARLRDPSTTIKAEAALILKHVLDTFSRDDTAWTYKRGWKSLAEIRSQIAAFKFPIGYSSPYGERLQKLESWSKSRTD